jgi:hypothetical protein
MNEDRFMHLKSKPDYYDDLPVAEEITTYTCPDCGERYDDGDLQPEQYRTTDDGTRDDDGAYWVSIFTCAFCNKEFKL